jgi:hypothetical protein
MPKNNAAAADQDRIIKTTIELPSPLAEQVTISVYKKKIKDRKYTMKQFITDAIIKALETERSEHAQ